MGVCKPCIEKLYLWAIILEGKKRLYIYVATADKTLPNG